MVLHELDGDVAVGQQLHVVEKLARRNGAGALFLHARRARRTQRKIKIGGRDGQAIAHGFEEKVRQDRDGRLALHHSGGGGEFLE